MPNSTDLFYYCCCGEGDVQARQEKLERIDRMTTELRQLTRQQLECTQAGNSEMAQLLSKQVQQLEKQLAKEEENISAASMCGMFLCVLVCTGAIASSAVYILNQ
jgi:hypothetical protein